jgi:hypothetical protein
MLFPSVANAKSRHNSYYNSDVRYGKRANMMRSLGIHHHTTRK